MSNIIITKPAFYEIYEAMLAKGYADPFAFQKARELAEAEAKKKAAEDVDTFDDSDITYDDS